MSEMVERVAALISKAVHDHIDPKKVARAAIEVMREPSEQMCEIGINGGPGTWENAGPDDVWRAMIDAALSSSEDAPPASPPDLHAR